MDVVLADVVDDDLDGLRAVWHVEHDRLEEIDVLLRQVAVVDHHLQVGILMLAVGLLQPQFNDAGALELLRFREVELRVVPLALLLEQHQFVVRVRDGPGEFSARVDEIALRARQAGAGIVDRLALGIELRLQLLEARIVGLPVSRGGTAAAPAALR